MIYVYCFTVWPDEDWGFSTLLFDIFRLLNTRVEMHFSQAEIAARHRGAADA